MNVNEQCVSILREQQLHLKQLGFRLPFFLMGDIALSIPFIELLLNHHTMAEKKILVVGKEPAFNFQANDTVKTITSKQYQDYLGHEFDFVIFNGFAGFHVNAFTALAGTLKAGGLFICLMPPLAQWASYTDPDKQRASQWPENGLFYSHFLQRLADRIQQDVNPPCLVLDINSLMSEQTIPSALLSLSSIMAPALKQQTQFKLPTRITAEQANAIEKIKQLKKQHCALLIADRGRGKSTCLGLAAAQYHKVKPNHSIIISAPRNDCTLLAEQWYRAHQSNQEKTLKFVAIDHLIQHRPHADLLMIDEAAALPSEQLQKLTLYYPKIVFATTINGYEGSGQGFALRFSKAIANESTVLKLQLTQPIRWQQGDYLERFCNEHFLLSPKIDSSCGDNTQPTTIEFYSAEELLAQEALLKQVFNLLTQAHYRTTPDDLRYLLDSPNLQLLLIRRGNVVEGVCLVSLEGGLPKDLCQQITAGQRRPKGHLVPQVIAAQFGDADFASLKGWRIVRIAVRGSARCQGFASQLITYLHQVGQAKKLDYMAASFGAHHQLLNFWQKNNFKLIRLGLKAETSTGLFSALMLQPMSATTKKQCLLYQQNGWQNILLHLTTYYQNIEVKLLNACFNCFPLYQAHYQPTPFELNLVQNFAFKQGNLEAARLAIFKLLLTTSFKELTTTESLQLLADHALAQLPIATLADKYKLTGRKQVISALRQACQMLLACQSIT